MHALGRLFNVRYVADGGYVTLRDAGGVTFLCYLTGAAGDTYTLQEAKDVSGTSAQNLAVITRYWTSTGDGSDTWVLHTQAAAATITTAATAAENFAIFDVEASSLDDTYTALKVTSTGAGLVTPIVRDLAVQRMPSNLPKLS